MFDLPSWTENAVLVYGPRKAGTTLLLNLLDGGELVVDPDEVKLKFMAPGRAPDLRAHAHSIHRSSPAPARPVGWAMKEVGGDTERVVELFKSMFPAGRVLMITRDAKMISRSVYRDRRRRGVSLPLRKLWKEARDPVRVLRLQSAFRGRPGFHFVSYENLTGGKIREEMTEVAEFLGVDYTEAFERPTIFGQPVVVATASRDTTEVFNTNALWTDGLEFREKLCVRLYSLGARSVRSSQP